MSWAEKWMTMDNNAERILINPVRRYRAAVARHSGPGRAIICLAVSWLWQNQLTSIQPACVDKDAKRRAMQKEAGKH